MLEQKGKKFNLILISGSGKGSFHISKNGIKNPLIKKMNEMMVLQLSQYLKNQNEWFKLNSKC